MMSCYEGLIELGRVLDDPLYKEAAERTAGSIRRDEINIAGSGAASSAGMEARTSRLCRLIIRWRLA